VSEPANSIQLPVLPEQPSTRKSIALVGNPNAGKTSLFNRLTGLRAKTANYPGTTVDHRQATLTLGPQEVLLIDLPGAYGLDATSPEEEVTCGALRGSLSAGAVPDVVLLVVDATNLQRNLFLASQILELGRPMLVALNMIDEAERQGLKFDVIKLEAELGCEVVPVSARSGRNLQRLLQALQRRLETDKADSRSVCEGCTGCKFAARYDWAEEITRQAVSGDDASIGQWTRAIDRVVTHKLAGLICFAAVMIVTFMLIFWLAAYPMDRMDALFSFAADTMGGVLPTGDFNSLVTEGIIGGVGGMLVFLPQIFILFFLISLLEDSGYLARAAFVMDKLMYRVGLPGKAFVPLLAAHACAIPAIMSSRVIDDKRDRLNTILIIPLMTCSARVPVFAMIVALLFPHNALFAALTFSGAYALAVVSALLIGFILKRSLLPGRTKPLVLELPRYRWPSLRNALLTSLDRSRVFVRKAGTIILVFSLVLWFLATYPKTGRQDYSESWQQRLAEAEEAGDDEASETLLAQARSEYSFAGRMGKVVQPVFDPLGFDWRLSVGVINSFAAREVMVSTLAILYGSADDEAGLLASLDKAQRADGTPVFTLPTCFSLLVFYIYAMQCLPTLAVVKRELKTWKWPIFQFVYMSLLAYVAALITYQITSAWT
jgi:ferrous iron transport protein B